MKKRIICLLLIITILFGIVPMPARAEMVTERSGVQYIGYVSSSGELLDTITMPAEGTLRVEIACSEPYCRVYLVRAQGGVVHPSREYDFYYDDYYKYSYEAVYELDEGQYTIATDTTNVNFYGGYCWYSYTMSYEAHTHSYSFTKVVQPTCTSKGYTLYTCDCGDTEKDDYVDKLPHTEVDAEPIPPTCNTPGKAAGGKKCSVCGVYTLEPEVIPATGLHTEEVVEAVAATCSKTGLTEGKKCTICGFITLPQETVPTIPHTEKTIPAKEATCTESGLTEGTVCSVCNAVLQTQETVQPIPHTESVIPGLEPLCVKPGKTERIICSVCSTVVKEEQVIPADPDKHIMAGDVCRICGLISGGTVLVSGCWNDATTWSILDDGTFVVSGTGTMEGNRWTNRETPWDNYKVAIKTVIVAEGITDIISSAFAKCTNLTTVYIADSVRSIDYGAFYNCVALENIDIPNGVTTIDSDAFLNCHGLRSIVLPESVTTLGDWPFCYCDKLESLTIPGSVQDIPAGVAMNCPSLRTVILSEGTKTIGSIAFQECPALNTITIPASVEYIAENAFSNTGLTEIIFLGDAPAFSENKDTFEGVSATAYYPAGNQTWTEAVMQNYGGSIIWSANCPDHSWDEGVVTTNPTEDYEGVMTYSCTICGTTKTQSIPRLEHTHKYEALVTAPTCTEPGFTTYTCACGDCYVADQTNALAHDYENGTCTRCGAPDPDQGETTTPDGLLYEIVSLADGSYVKITGCEGTASEITIPEQIEGLPVVSIDLYAFYDCDHLVCITLEAGISSIGNGAFWNCDNLSGIYVDSNNEYYASDESGVLFNKDKTKLIQAPRMLSGAYTLPESVATIDISAFEGCSELTSLTIGSSITEIGHSAFHGCNSLKDINYKGSEEQWANVTIAGAGNSNLLNAAVHYEAKPEHVHDYTGVVTEPSCGDMGYTTYTCACGDSYTEDYVDPLGHLSLGIGVEVAPDCTTPGFTSYLCLVCGEIYADDHVPPLGHDYENGICTRCGADDPDHSEPVVPVNPFTDVAGVHYFYTPVLWAVENGITSGTSATTFSPDQTCTRSQVVTFLWRAMGQPEPETTETAFTDIAPGAFYYKAVLWAVENGITSGLNATTFGPGEPCTRAQVVTFLWRALGKPESKNVQTDFTDTLPGAFYEKPVLWAVENGITSGLNATTFAPDNACTRGQVVTFLYRAMGDQ